MNKINHISRHRLTLSHVLSNVINQVQKCDHHHVLLTIPKTCTNISQKWIHSAATNCFERRSFNNNNNYNNNRRTEWKPPQLHHEFVSPQNDSKRKDKSQYDSHVKACRYIENWMTDILKNYEPEKTVINWEEVKEKAKDFNNLINEKSFGGMILGECSRREEQHFYNPKENSKDNVFEIVQDFMKWNRKPTLLILAAYMQLCSYNMDKVNEKSLLNMYNSISNKVQGVWSHDLATKVITGILKTSKWKDSIQIMEDCSKHDKHYITCTSDVAAKAFEEQEFDLGWSILSASAVKHDSHYRKSSTEPFIAFLNNCPPTEENLQKLLDYLDVHEIYPSKGLLSAIVNFFEKNLGYRAHPTRVHGKTKTCQICRQPLDTSDLSVEEFQRLQSHFLNSVVLKDDVFINTTPDEIQEYQEFLARYGPFDVVLDALNISFSLSLRHSDPGLVESAAYKFSTEGKRTLIIGRKHMNRWPRSVLRNISDTGYLFLIDDHSEDDPFILYGALKSGPNTIFISKDFMRQHAYQLLDAQISRLFKRWRWTHQMDFYWNHYDMKLKPFTELLPVPQKNTLTGTYHIPYSIEELASPYDLPDKWMCISQKIK